MPRSASTPCRVPGCPRLSTGGYCPEHRGERDSDTEANRPTAAQRGYDHRWRKVRAMQLRRYPLCADCLEAGRVTRATQAHHLVAVRDGGQHELSNLLSLCATCHSRRTGKGE